MRLNLDQPSARRSTEIKICPDIENMPEIMINNLAQDVQNIRENKNIVECGKVVLLGNNATTNIRWWSI